MVLSEVTLIYLKRTHMNDTNKCTNKRYMFLEFVRLNFKCPTFQPFHIPTIKFYQKQHDGKTYYLVLHRKVMKKNVA